MGVELAKAYIRVRADNTQLRPDLARSQAIVSGAMSRIGQIARDAFAGLGAIGIGAALFSGMRTAVEFEDTMVKLRINARLLGQEGEAAFGRLSAKARELGASTRFSASEAADSLNRLVLAGLSVEDTLAAVDHVLNGAAAAGIGLEQSANILTTQMKIWKFEASELARVNDTLISAQTRLRTEMAELSGGMSVAGTLAKKVGLDFEQTAAMVGLMIEQGTEAGAAGTALRNAIMRMAQAPKELQDALGELGYSIEDFTSATGEVQFEKFLEAIKNVELTSSQVTGLFGARGGEFIKVLQAIDSEGRRGMDVVNALAQGMRDDAGMSAEAAAARMETMKGAILSLKSALEELALSVLTPVVQGFAEVGKAVTIAVRAFAKFNEITGGLASETIKVTVAMTTFAFLLPKLVTGVRLLGMAIKTQLIGTGFGAIAVAVGAAIVALMQLYKWISSFPEIQAAWAAQTEKLQMAWENFKVALDAIWKAIVAAVNVAIDVIENLFGITIGNIQDTFLGFVSQLISLFADGVLEISQWIRVIAENWKLVWEFISNRFQVVMMAIVNSAVGVFMLLVEGFKRTGTVIVRFWDMVWADIKHRFGAGAKEALDEARAELAKAEVDLGNTLRDVFAPSEAQIALEKRNREIVEELKRAKADLDQAQNEALFGEKDGPLEGAKMANDIGAAAGKKMAEAFHLEQGRYGFADFGKAIQDQLLGGGEKADAERNDLLEEGNKIQDEQLDMLKMIEDKLGQGGRGGMLAPGDT